MKAYHRKTLPIEVGREPSAVSETTTILRIMFKVMHVMLHVWVLFGLIESAEGVMFTISSKNASLEELLIRGIIGASL